MQETQERGSSPRRKDEEYRALSHRILHYASKGAPIIDFLCEISRMLAEFSGCDFVSLWVKEDGKYYRCGTTKRGRSDFHFEVLPHLGDADSDLWSAPGQASDLERLGIEVVERRFDRSSRMFTRNGSFWTGTAGKGLERSAAIDKKSRSDNYGIGGDYPSLALVPLSVADENVGLMVLKSRRRGYLSQSQVQFYERVGRNLGVAIIYQRAQAALRERVKELTCLYGIAQLSQRPGITSEEILREIVELLPAAWQYPQITSARVILDGNPYATPGFKDTTYTQSADVLIGGEKRGTVEVGYIEERPERDEGPFLRDERHLIDAVARQVGLIMERRRAEEDRLRLQDQLRHADRLATIGELAAGVAHELNEPLGAVLGYAQLAKKSGEIGDQTARDIDKIATSALHAREVVKKLMTFARQMPPKKTNVNLNDMVEEGLYFLESRCAKEGIQLVRQLEADLPDIVADPAQLNQVLVNLAVNAMQAMAGGGKLTISTRSSHEKVHLIVEDTGKGMTEEVMKQIFVPFFTTKDVGEGTGLGLAVVHGIISSHRGDIKVGSKVGVGSRFEVELPANESPEIEEKGRDG